MKARELPTHEDDVAAHIYQQYYSCGYPFEDLQEAVNKVNAEAARQLMKEQHRDVGQQ